MDEDRFPAPAVPGPGDDPGTSAAARVEGDALDPEVALDYSLLPGARFSLEDDLTEAEWVGERLELEGARFDLAFDLRELARGEFEGELFVDVDRTWESAQEDLWYRDELADGLDGLDPDWF